MKSLSDLKLERDMATSKTRAAAAEIELAEQFKRLFEQHDAGVIIDAAVRALDDLRQEYYATAKGTYFEQVRNFFSGDVPLNPEVGHAVMVKSMHDLELP